MVTTVSYPTVKAETTETDDHSWRYLVDSENNTALDKNKVYQMAATRQMIEARAV